MTPRLRSTVIAAMLALALVVAPACQRTVEVQTGTRIVDSQGRVISEDLHMVRVPAETASAYRIVTITQPDAQSPQAAQLYAQAQAAIAAGDLTAAGQKLAQLIAIAPDYPNAKAQADAIKQGKNPGTDAGGSKPSTTTPSTQPTATAGSLLRWVPDSLAGFSAMKALVDPLQVTREYKPASGSSAASLVIVAGQFRNSTQAKAALKSEVKQRYTKSASTQTVNGRTTYFGTDGSRFAVLGFTSGPVMVAIEMSSRSGSPSQLKSALVKVAQQLP